VICSITANDFYNKAAANLPDHDRLKDLKLPGASVVLDRKGKPFAEVFEENQRRVWVRLAEIPQHVRSAFIAAEDKRFYQRKGVDEHGLIRAFIGNLTGSRRLQGGSTITQQVVKNLLVGDEVSYERKIREMIVAARVKSTLNKDAILELYLNSVYQYGAHTVGEVLKIVRPQDPAWVSAWVTAKLLDGTLSGDHWKPFLIPVSQPQANNLIEQLATRELQFREMSATLSILSASATPELAGQIFAKLCEVQRTVSAGGTHRQEGANPRSLRAPAVRRRETNLPPPVV
jgi:hypothetical protein